MDLGLATLNKLQPLGHQQPPHHGPQELGTSVLYPLVLDQRCGDTCVEPRMKFMCILDS